MWFNGLKELKVLNELNRLKGLKDIIYSFNVFDHFNFYL